jgi:hypothetical protein
MAEPTAFEMVPPTAAPEVKRPSAVADTQTKPITQYVHVSLSIGECYRRTDVCFQT